MSHRLYYGQDIKSAGGAPEGVNQMASLRSAYDLRNAEMAIFSALLAARKEYGGKKVVLHDADDRKLTYDDIVRAAFALGSALKPELGGRNGEGAALPRGGLQVDRSVPLVRLKVSERTSMAASVAES